VDGIWYYPRIYTYGDPYGMPMGAGMAGACAAGTCSGGVAAGGCSGPGGCGMGGSCASLLYFLDLALMETDSQQGYGDMGGGCGGSGGCGGGGGGCGGGGGNAIYQRFFCSSIRVGFITLETFFHEMRS
jgi:hypothetical protein